MESPLFFFSPFFLFFCNYCCLLLTPTNVSLGTGQQLGGRPEATMQFITIERVSVKSLSSCWIWTETISSAVETIVSHF